mmetsp:Transcript_80082/g.214376  ORF Transcript_80082/g.214376 Transcript_80082/m.214376 type:complete len:213 (+) Transcript_80082:541-1179(+)
MISKRSATCLRKSKQWGRILTHTSKSWSWNVTEKVRSAASMYSSEAWTSVSSRSSTSDTAGDPRGFLGSAIVAGGDTGAGRFLMNSKGSNRPGSPGSPASPSAPSSHSASRNPSDDPSSESSQSPAGWASESDASSFSSLGRLDAQVEPNPGSSEQAVSSAVSEPDLDAGMSELGWTVVGSAANAARFVKKFAAPTVSENTMLQDGTHFHLI